MPASDTVCRFRGARLACRIQHGGRYQPTRVQDCLNTFESGGCRRPASDRSAIPWWRPASRIGIKMLTDMQLHCPGVAGEVTWRNRLFTGGQGESADGTYQGGAYHSV